MKRMIPLLFSLLCIWNLTGCTESGGDMHSETTTVPTTSHPETIPAITTVPTQPPETEPEVILEAGDAVTVDGTQLPGGSVIFDGFLYGKASEFLAALEGASFSGDETEGYTLVWEGDTFFFRPGASALIRNNEAVVLEADLITYQDALYLPIDPVCQMLNLSVFRDEAKSHVYCTCAAGAWEAASGHDVPVLMYHGVTDDTWGVVELFVSPGDLEEQLIYLTENGYEPIFFEDLRHIEDYEKPVILTFDDGYRDNYEYLFPLLQKYQVKATVFLITDNVDFREVTLTSQQIRQMVDSGLVSFQSHTATHPKLDEISQEQLEKELTQSKLAITRLTGREPFVLCYPSGHFNDTVQERTGEFYHFGIAMNGGLYTTGDDATRIPRYYVSRYTSLSEFACMVQGN